MATQGFPILFPCFASEVTWKPQIPVASHRVEFSSTAIRSLCSLRASLEFSSQVAKHGQIVGAFRSIALRPTLEPGVGRSAFLFNGPG